MVSTLANHDEAIRDAFVRWVSGQTTAPRAPASLIEHVELAHDYAGLLDTEVEGRRVVWKWLPAAARTRPTTAAIAQADVDCWTMEPDSLRQRSVHIAVCHGCAGEKSSAVAPALEAAKRSAARATASAKGTGMRRMARIASSTALSAEGEERSIALTAAAASPFARPAPERGASSVGWKSSRGNAPSRRSIRR